jgi:hypothetical protein
MEYSFFAKIWKYQGPAGWYFVTLPKLLSKKIRKRHGPAEEGWGRLKATVKIGKSKWKTSIWHDSHAESYLLPIKSSVRKAEEVKIGSRVQVVLELQLIDPKILKWLRA